MDYAGNIANYLTRVLGIEYIDRGDMKQVVKPFPVIVSNFFSGRLADIDGHECIFLRSRVTDVDFPMSLLIRRMKTTEEKLGRPCVLFLEALDGEQRRQLIKHKIGFVVPERQLYLPSLGTYLTESRLNTRKEVSTLTPAAQLLLFYHLEKKSLSGIGFKQVAELLGYPPKTISLVSSEISQCELGSIELTGNGRGKCIRFKTSGRELWEQALPMLSSPVDKVGYISGQPDVAGLIRSYDDALSHYTDMGQTPGHAYAVEKRSEAGRRLTTAISTANLPDSTRIELWKYNPATLAEDGFIDPLSMALIYKDYDDERVQGQIKRLLDRIL